MYEVGDGTQTILATSRTLPLRPSEVKTAVQDWVDRVTRTSSGPAGELRLDLPGGARARLRPGPLHGASAEGRSLLIGTIRSRHGWVSVPVEIETTPITGTHSELVVRPVGSLCLRRGTHRRLFDRCSHTLADFFRMEIELARLAGTTPPVVVRTSPHPSEAVRLPA